MGEPEVSSLHGVSWAYAYRSSFQEQDDGIEEGMTLSDWFDAKQNQKPDGADNLAERRFSATWTGFSDDSDGPSPSHDTSEDSMGPGATMAILQEQRREAIREALVAAAGGPMEAFRAMDLSRNHTVTPTEFNDGMHRLGVNWQEITGFAKYQDVFKLFDCDGSLSLTLDELFPATYLYLSHRRN